MILHAFSSPLIYFQYDRCDIDAESSVTPLAAAADALRFCRVATGFTPLILRCRHAFRLINSARQVSMPIIRCRYAEFYADSLPRRLISPAFDCCHAYAA